jgi:hypothetical protein
VPTIQPSFAPTDSKDLLVFKLIFTINGASDVVLSGNGQKALLDTITKLGAVEPGSSEYLGIRSYTRRQLLEAHQLITGTRIRLPLVDYAPLNSTQLYNEVTKRIDNAVTDGSFTKELIAAARADDASELYNVTI